MDVSKGKCEWNGLETQRKKGNVQIIERTKALYGYLNNQICTK